MQVTINVDSSTIGATVEEVFKSLSPEAKRQLAMDLMREVLTKPNGAERIAYEEQAAQAVYEEKRSSNYDRLDSVEAARGTYQFKDRMKEYMSSKDRMVKTITEEALQQYKEAVKDMVANDPQLQAVYAEVRASIISNYPHMVQAAMNHWMAGQMASIGSAMQMANSTQVNVGMALTHLTQSLSNQGIKI